MTDRINDINWYSASTTKLVAFFFVLSGMTGLIYEVLWARMLGLVFGATTLAVSTVLAAFMGGLALGSLLAGRYAASLKRPLRVYGLIEAGIAVYAVMVPLLFKLVDGLYALLWQQLHPNFFIFSVWRFLLSGATLLIPTTLMGATLPVLAAMVLRKTKLDSTSVTQLYTYNLFGAILGTILAGFVLLPQLGLLMTIFVAASINFIIGIGAVLLDRRKDGAAQADVAVAEEINIAKEGPSVSAGNGYSFWLACAFVSGFVTISTQVAWTRVLTMVIGSSTYAFTIVVALFLIGLSIGAFEISRKKNLKNLTGTLFRIEVGTAVALILSLWIVNQIPWLLVQVGLSSHLSTWRGLMLLQVGCAAILILFPAYLMGTVMPLVLAWAGDNSSRNSVVAVGHSYALNTVGAIAGAFCSGFILIPKTGTRFTVLVGVALCLLIAGAAFTRISTARDRDLTRAITVGATIAAIGLAFVIAPRLNLAELSIGAYDSLVRVLARSKEPVPESEQQETGDAQHKLLMYEEGPTSTVSVRRDWGVTALAINGRTNASDGEDMSTQVMLAQLPLLLAPSLKNGLIVGFASGVSAGAILQSPIESVTCVELEPATITASHYFDHVNNHPLNDSRLHLVIDDARTYLRGNSDRYDLIMSEPSHPWVPGVANLFTQEFFDLGRRRLNDGGVFVQWLQVYQLSNENLRSVLATFHKVFPHMMVFRVGGSAKGKDLIVAGSSQPLSLDRVASRLQDERTSAELSRVGIRNEADVRSWFVCDESKVRTAVTGATINSDDNMHVESTAPRDAFLPLRQTNAAWIESLSQAK